MFTKTGCVYKHGLGAPIHFPMLSPYLFMYARCKHGFCALIVTQNVVTNVDAHTHTDATVSIG